MSKEHGGAAFPQSGFERWAPEGGMTLRDYFAAKAMQGFNANPEFNERSHDFLADLAYDQADAMLAARAK